MLKSIPKVKNCKILFNNTAVDAKEHPNLNPGNSKNFSFVNFLINEKSRLLLKVKKLKIEMLEKSIIYLSFCIKFDNLG